MVKMCCKDWQQEMIKKASSLVSTASKLEHTLNVGQDDDMSPPFAMV